MKENNDRKLHNMTWHGTVERQDNKYYHDDDDYYYAKIPLPVDVRGSKASSGSF